MHPSVVVVVVVVVAVVPVLVVVGLVASDGGFGLDPGLFCRSRCPPICFPYPTPSAELLSSPAVSSRVYCADLESLGPLLQGACEARPRGFNCSSGGIPAQRDTQGRHQVLPASGQRGRVSFLLTRASALMFRVVLALRHGSSDSAVP
jgi:hypothetical protein